MRFKDRIDAGRQLASELSWLKEKNPVILGIPRGGVVVADVIAQSLDATLDVVVPRKLGAPNNPELAIGAVMHDGSTYLNEYVVSTLGVGKDYINSEISEQVKEIKRRLEAFRGNVDYDLKDKRVVLVDDGIATGATMMVSIIWARNQSPMETILAVPVVPQMIIEKMKEQVDKAIVIHSPREFGAVGEFFEDFSQTTDEEVINLLRKDRLTG